MRVRMNSLKSKVALGRLVTTRNRTLTTLVPDRVVGWCRRVARCAGVRGTDEAACLSRLRTLTGRICTRSPLTSQRRATAAAGNRRPVRDDSSLRCPVHMNRTLEERVAKPKHADRTADETPVPLTDPGWTASKAGSADQLANTGSGQEPNHELERGYLFGRSGEDG